MAQSHDPHAKRPAGVVMSSLVVVSDTSQGTSTLHKALRKQTHKMGVELANQMLSLAQFPGDHVRITHDIPAGDYTFALSATPEGYVKLDFTPGRVEEPAAAAAAD